MWCLCLTTYQKKNERKVKFQLSSNLLPFTCFLLLLQLSSSSSFKVCVYLCVVGVKFFFFKYFYKINYNITLKGFKNM